MRNLQFATWFSRIIRWGFAVVFTWIAYSYPGAGFLYFFAALIFITGFLVPRQCAEDNCNTQ